MLPAGTGPGEAEPVDSGLMGLVLIARFHQIAATPEGLRHQFAPVVKKLGEPAVFGDQEILLAAKSLGFRAKAATVSPQNLDNAILPLLAKNVSGEYFILVQEISGGGPSAIAREASAGEEAAPSHYLIHNLGASPGPRKVLRIYRLTFTVKRYMLNHDCELYLQRH